MQESGTAISEINFDIEAQVEAPSSKDNEVTCLASIFAEKLYV